MQPRLPQHRSVCAHPCVSPATSLAPEMSKPECRESRPVPFNANAIVWECAADGVISSTDVDAQGRLESPERRAPLPFQRQLPPGALTQRLPLAPTPGNVKRVERVERVDVEKRVFGREVSALEQRVESLSKRVRAQDALIRGFCNLEIARKK